LRSGGGSAIPRHPEPGSARAVTIAAVAEIVGGLLAHHLGAELAQQPWRATTPS
jgi:hypothetical protein